MTNPFKEFGITHLSYSSLNEYIESPALWCLKYLHGKKEEGNAKMWCGTAVEAGVDVWLFAPRKDESAYFAAQEVASGVFDVLCAGEITDELDKERRNVADMLAKATDRLKHYPIPDARQLKAEYWFDGIEVPLQLWIDYLWEDQGLELKTTRALPSSIKAAHARQAGLYSLAKKRPFHVLYVTPKKCEMYPVENAEGYVKQLECAAKAVRNVLNAGKTVEGVSQLFIPDYEFWKWSPSLIEAAKPIWG